MLKKFENEREIIIHIFNNIDACKIKDCKFGQDFINFILYNNINKNKIEESDNYKNKATSDVRTPLTMYINIFLGEIFEKLFIINNCDFRINEEASHNTFKNINNKTDLVYKYNIYIEFQNSIDFLDKFYLKKKKYYNLIKEYKDKECYIIQQYINSKTKDIFYRYINIKDINIKNVEKDFAWGKERYILKDYKEIKNINELDFN